MWIFEQHNHCNVVDRILFSIFDYLTVGNSIEMIERHVKVEEEEE